MNWRRREEGALRFFQELLKNWRGAAKISSFEFQYLLSPPLVMLSELSPLTWKKICHTGGGNEATIFFHSSLTYRCFGTTILNFFTCRFAKNWQMQWNHQIQDDGAGNLKVIIFSFYYHIFCSVKCMGQLSLNTNLRWHNVTTSLCKWHVLQYYISYKCCYCLENGTART